MRSCFSERETTSAWRETGGGGERLKDRGGRRGCRKTGRTVSYVCGDAVNGEETATCLTRHLLSLSLSLSSQELNLSYQDLGDPFQQENFLRILRRLIRVEKLQLVDNSLTNLSSVRLPRFEPPLSPRPECMTKILNIWSDIRMETLLSPQNLMPARCSGLRGFNSLLFSFLFSFLLSSLSFSSPLFPAGAEC